MPSNTEFTAHIFSNNSEPVCTQASMFSWTVWGLTAISNSLRVASTRTTAKQTVHYTISRWSTTAKTFIKPVLWIRTHLGMYTRPGVCWYKTKGTFKLMKQSTLNLDICTNPLKKKNTTTTNMITESILMGSTHTDWEKNIQQNKNSFLNSNKQLSPAMRTCTHKTFFSRILV